jgi:hypothetical protein
MRLFVFAIGGTGSKVLTQFVMMLAAGVRPLDATTGKPLENFSVVPIIIDPHVENAGLQEAQKLLTSYRNIRKRIYGDEQTARSGFFSVKVETLKDVNKNQNSNVEDKFYFRSDAISKSKFSDFISLKDMSTKNEEFSKLIFSEDELNTQMKEGFFGSPNIGCVALRDFVNSQDFKNICGNFNLNGGDRMFFIGSLFGGTGAAGLPLLISSIRFLGNSSSNTQVATEPAKSPIGALMMLPYFSIQKDEKSSIDMADWFIKSKSALSYYEKNLDKYINSIYYVADQLMSKPYDNDPGYNGQSANKAHIAEFCGALSLFDFAGIDKDNLTYNEGKNEVEKSDCHYNCYSFKSSADASITAFSFKFLPASTNVLVMKPLMKFFILRNFMSQTLKKCSGKPFAKQLDSNILNIPAKDYLEYFFGEFDNCFKEMEEQGNRKLHLFNAVQGEDYTNAFVDVGTPVRKIAFAGHKKATASDLEGLLNEENNNYKDIGNQYNRWFTIANNAMDRFLEADFDLTNFING